MVCQSLYLMGVILFLKKPRLFKLWVALIEVLHIKKESVIFYVIPTTKLSTLASIA